MKISTLKSDAVVLSEKLVIWSTVMENEYLPQVKEFKYLRVLLTSEGTMDQDWPRNRSSESDFALTLLHRCDDKRAFADST